VWGLRLTRNAENLIAVLRRWKEWVRKTFNIVIAIFVSILFSFSLSFSLLSNAGESVNALATFDVSWITFLMKKYYCIPEYRLFSLNFRQTFYLFSFQKLFSNLWEIFVHTKLNDIGYWYGISYRKHNSMASSWLHYVKK
jgi:hypothetical protein